MHKTSSDDIENIAQDVDKLCSSFLEPRGLSHFQFKRIYRDGSFFILANRPDFFHDFLEKDLVNPCPRNSIYIRQSSIFFWDESLPPARVSYIRAHKGVYHGLTIISRRKNFFDCTTFAMGKLHECPFAFYFHSLKEIQKFAELFPTIARNSIEKVREYPQKYPPLDHFINRKCFFLPKRSSRFRIGESAKEYITTYEALCVQLIEEGKSYKEIGSILSMAPSTVETHLKRLRARTGLTLQELTLQFFDTHTKGKRVLHLDHSKDLHPIKAPDPKNRKIRDG
jgi:DNA-binding CsgD family transcriptional regulator